MWEKVSRMEAPAKSWVTLASAPPIMAPVARSLGRHGLIYILLQSLSIWVREGAMQFHILPSDISPIVDRKALSTPTGACPRSMLPEMPHVYFQNVLYNHSAPCPQMQGPLLLGLPWACCPGQPPLNRHMERKGSRHGTATMTFSCPLCHVCP